MLQLIKKLREFSNGFSQMTSMALATLGFEASERDSLMLLKQSKDKYLAI